MSKKSRIIISIICGIYFALITSPVEWHSFEFCFVFIFKLVVFIFVISALIKYLDKIKLPKKNLKITKKTYILWFLYIFIVMLIALAVYYPTNYTFDLSRQYDQAISGHYIDWHPVIHTIIFYRFPTLLIKSKIMCSLFQMIIVDFILLYFCHFLEKYKLNKYVITIILSVFILNPSFDYMAISPVKDTMYSYSIFLLTLYFINIYLSKGEWINKKTNFIAVVLACFGIVFFRHNGIGTFILVMISMIFIYKNIRKKIIMIFLIIMSLRFIFIPCVYKLNHIDKTTFTFSETICIMLNQISYIYNNNGKITSEQLKVLGKMQDLRLMEEKYNPYNYDSIKFANDDFYNVYSPYINKHKKEFLKLWYELVKNNKMQAVKSYLYTTYMIWHVDIDTSQDLRDLSYNIFSGNYKVNSKYYYQYMKFQEAYFNYKRVFCYLPFNLIFVSSSMALFIILFSLLYGLFKVKDKLKLAVVYLPVLTNLMIILLIIPGREARFTYPHTLCFIPFIILMILINQKDKKKKEIL